MSLAQLTVDLWKRAPAWRFLVFGALLATILAVMSGGVSSTTTGQGNQSVANNNQALNNHKQSVSQPQSVTDPNCGPPKSTQQAVQVVTQSGQKPSNVTAVGNAAPQIGMSTATQARIKQFMLDVDAAMTDSREGESCVRMAGALDALQLLDYGHTHCFVDGDKKISKAKSCAENVDAHNRRFEALLAAHERLKKDASAASVERLSEAFASMNSFDKSTEQWNFASEAVKRAEQAVDQIRTSDERIQKLAFAAGNAKGAETAANLQALSLAGQLTALDKARLGSTQAEWLQAASDAKKKLSESDQRFSALALALNTDSSSDSDARASLIDAVSRLDQFDLSRASTEQLDMINKAKQGAATYAMEDLLQTSKVFNLDSALPAAFVRMRDLRALVMEYGEVEASDPELAQALDMAKRAEVALIQSDTRIRSMQEILALVREGGPSEFGQSVIDAYESIRPFDIARFSEEEKREYSELEAARDVSVATTVGQLTYSVPVFLRAENNETLLLEAEKQLRDGLLASGFNLVDAQEQSAVSLVLTMGKVLLKEVNFSGSTIRTAEIAMRLKGRWTIGDQTITIPKAGGEAIRGDADLLTGRAISDGVAQLIDSLEVLAGGQ